MNGLAVMPPDRWMEINLLDTLRRHYCSRLEVFHYPGGMGQLGSREWRMTREVLNHELLHVARALKSSGRLDFVFCIVYDDFLLVETARQLQGLNVPMVNYHVDMAFQWYRVIRIAPYFNVMAVAQRTKAEHLRRYNDRIEWMPMAANPDFYRSARQADTSYRYSVSFVGSVNPYRRAWLAACVQRGMRPTVFGRGWQGELDGGYSFEWDWYKVFHDLRYYAAPRWRAEGLRSLVGPLQRKYARRHRLDFLEGPEYHSPCADEQLSVIFKESRVNLGFSDTGWHHTEGVKESDNLQCRLRDFEVPMSGGFYLVQEAPDHRDYYKLGHEIETWSAQEELTDKIAFYLKHPASAERIRQAGERRAITCHTWRHRFDRLFERVGLLPRSSKAPAVA